jgi:hypothetical protein
MAINFDQIVPITDVVVNEKIAELKLIATVLTKNIYVPNNATQRVLQFADALSVSNYFGIDSGESAIANQYFQGYDNATLKPIAINFAKYIEDPISPYLMGGIVSATPLEIVTVGGSMTFTVDGVTKTITPVLTGLITYSAIAGAVLTAIKTAFSTLTTATFIYDATRKMFMFNTMQTGSTHTIGFCGTGLLAGAMKLQLIDGGALSQGADAQSPADNMDAFVAITRNWVAFYTMFDTGGSYPDYPIEIGLAEWTTNNAPNYVYIVYSSEVNLTITGNTSNINAVLTAGEYVNWHGTYGDISIATLVATIGACIDYDVTNGTIAWSAKHQAGVQPSVTSSDVATALKIINWNFYGQYSSKSQEFIFYEQGTIVGKYLFIDNVYNQLWLANELQNSIGNLLSNVGKLPNDQVGYATVKSALTVVMNSAVNNGVAEPDQVFDNTQKAELKIICGYDCSSALSQTGYVIVITPATPAQKSARQPPNTKIVYTNGGAILTLPIETAFFS